MDQIATTILASGKSAVELALFVLLPIMIVMLSLMRWMESNGWLNRIITLTAPLLKPFGLTGLGVFALIQVMMVSFSAPLATLAVMARTGSAPRHIAATLAMVLALAQANVVFPMAAAGLNIPVTLLIALGGGLLAAAATYYVFGRHLSLVELNNDQELMPETEPPRGMMAVIRRAGSDAWEIAIGALPLLVVALVAVNLVRLTSVIELLEAALAPAFLTLGYPPETLLLAITKYVAGGTAMMGIAMDQFANGLIGPQQINLLAGLLLCPLDVAGVAILLSAGKPVAAVAKPAIYGALVGVAFRVVCHGLLYL